MKKTFLTVFLLICASSLISQDSPELDVDASAGELAAEESAAEELPAEEMSAEARSSIPEELLRPQRGESARYPIDIVIGEIGQGQAPREAYECAKTAATELMKGNAEARVFSNLNKAFIDINESISALDEINPRSYRLGGGNIMPDGSVSFLIRFIGRELGITGEIYIRLEERRIEITPVRAEPEIIDAENGEAEIEIEAEAEEEVIEEEITPVYRFERDWFFEEIILEPPRSRGEENAMDKSRFDFSPYERVF